MYDKPIGVSVLTNGARFGMLQRCLQTLLADTAYRPLVIGIFDNGSTDETAATLARHRASMNEIPGVTWRLERSEGDLGCATGTNRSIALVDDCELQLHLESDFYLLPPEVSGTGRDWLHDAAEFMAGQPCDYLYLRRMRDEREAIVHDWAQWHDVPGHQVGPYRSCPGFWWSNNPALFRVQAMYGQRTLPLDAAGDGPKGTPLWSQPELTATRPSRAWIHHWGMFAHETPTRAKLAGCGGYSATGAGLPFGAPGPGERIFRFGASGCKYGWFKDPASPWCERCDRSKGPEDMAAHQARFRAYVEATHAAGTHTSADGA